MYFLVFSSTPHVIQLKIKTSILMVWGGLPKCMHELPLLWLPASETASRIPLCKSHLAMSQKKKKKKS